MYEKGRTVSEQEIGISLKKLDSIRQNICIFGDKMVVHKLMDLADVCQYRLETYIRNEGVEDELRYLHKEIERLNEKKKWLENYINSLENEEK